MRTERSPRIMVRGARASVPRLALAQGLYYLLTGVWPLADIKSFQTVTGPKTDLWLVKTVGLLVSVIGGALTVGAARGRASPEMKVLGAGSAAGLAGIDTVYATKRRISKIYLLDAVIEALMVVSWIAAARRERRTGRGWLLRRIASWR